MTTPEGPGLTEESEALARWLQTEDNDFSWEKLSDRLAAIEAAAVARHVRETGCDRLREADCPHHCEEGHFTGDDMVMAEIGTGWPAKWEAALAESETLRKALHALLVPAYEGFAKAVSDPSLVKFVPEWLRAWRTGCELLGLPTDPDTMDSQPARAALAPSPATRPSGCAREGCGHTRRLHDVDREDGPCFATVACPCTEYLVSPATEEVGVMNGAERIVAERQRQIEVEGYAPGRDEDPRELAAAAAAYLLVAAGRWLEARVVWPWPMEFFKPYDFARDVERGGALAAAALDGHARLVSPATEEVE